jgi:hypothetical protein
MASYHLIAFTPFVDDPYVQYLVGWSLIGVTTLNILVNMAVMGYSSFKKIKNAIREMI